MSLNNIELGDLIVSELYRNSLLAAEAAALPARISGPAQTAAHVRHVSAPETGTPVARTSPPSTPEVKTASPTGLKPESTSARLTSPGQTDLPAGPAQTAPVRHVSADGNYKFLGNNRRRITVLVQSPGVAFLPDDQLSFLTRMLEACKMNVGDVAIVNLANAPVTIAALKQQLQPNVILLFGMEPVAIRLPMNFPWFKIQGYDECTYLCAPSLQELVLPGEDSKLLKSKLWMCLKTLFEI